MSDYSDEGPKPQQRPPPQKLKKRKLAAAPLRSPMKLPENNQSSSSNKAFSPGRSSASGQVQPRSRLGQRENTDHSPTTITKVQKGTGVSSQNFNKAPRLPGLGRQSSNSNSQLGSARGHFGRANPMKQDTQPMISQDASGMQFPNQDYQGDFQDTEVFDFDDSNVQQQNFSSLSKANLDQFNQSNNQSVNFQMDNNFQRNKHVSQMDYSKVTNARKQQQQMMNTRSDNVRNVAASRSGGLHQMSEKPVMTAGNRLQATQQMQEQRMNQQRQDRSGSNSGSQRSQQNQQNPYQPGPPQATTVDDKVSLNSADMNQYLFSQKDYPMQYYALDYKMDNVTHVEYSFKNDVKHEQAQIEMYTMINNAVDSQGTNFISQIYEINDKSRSKSFHQQPSQKKFDQKMAQSGFFDVKRNKTMSTGPKKRNDFASPNAEEEKIDESEMPEKVELKRMKSNRPPEDKVRELWHEWVTVHQKQSVEQIKIQKKDIPPEDVKYLVKLIEYGEFIYQHNEIVERGLEGAKLTEYERKTIADECKTKFHKDCLGIFLYFLKYGFNIKPPKKESQGMFKSLGNFMSSEAQKPTIISKYIEMTENSSFFNYIEQHKELKDLKTVQFMKKEIKRPKQLPEKKVNDDRGQLWLILSLYYLDDLETAFKMMMNDDEFKLNCYDDRYEDSFYSKYKSDVMYCIKSLKSRPMYVNKKKGMQMENVKKGGLYKQFDNFVNSLEFQKNEFKEKQKHDLDQLNKQNHSKKEAKVEQPRSMAVKDNDQSGSKDQDPQKRGVKWASNDDTGDINLTTEITQQDGDPQNSASDHLSQQDKDSDYDFDEADTVNDEQETIQFHGYDDDPSDSNERDYNSLFDVTLEREKVAEPDDDDQVLEETEPTQLMVLDNKTYFLDPPLLDTQLKPLYLKGFQGMIHPLIGFEKEPIELIDFLDVYDDDKDINKPRSKSPRTDRDDIADQQDDEQTEYIIDGQFQLFKVGQKNLLEQVDEQKIITKKNYKNFKITGQFFCLKAGMTLKQAKEYYLDYLCNSEIQYFNEFRKREHTSKNYLKNIKDPNKKSFQFIFQNKSKEYWIETREEKQRQRIQGVKDGAVSNKSSAMSSGHSEYSSASMSYPDRQYCFSCATHMKTQQDRFNCELCKRNNCKNCIIKDQQEFENLLKDAPGSSTIDHRRGQNSKSLKFFDPQRIMMGAQKRRTLKKNVQDSNIIHNLAGKMVTTEKQQQKLNAESYQYQDNSLCKFCVFYNKQFGYIRIDDANPLVKNDDWLREILKKRKRIHRQFDLIKCQAHWTFFDKDTNMNPKEDISQYRNLVLRDAIFTCEQMQNYELLERDLDILDRRIHNHRKRECNICEYDREKCIMCRQYINAEEVEKSMYSHVTRVLIHKKHWVGQKRVDCMAKHRERHIKEMECNLEIKKEVQAAFELRECQFWRNWYNKKKS